MDTAQVYVLGWLLLCSVPLIGAGQMANLGQLAAGLPGWNGLPELPTGAGDDLCGRQLQAVMDGLSGNSTWALSMFDAWGKIPSGILAGNTYALGHYDQCSGFRYDTREEMVGVVQGRYCLLMVPLDVLIPANQNPRAIPGGDISRNALKIGSCFPDTCSTDQLLDWLNATVSGIPNINMQCVRTTPPLGGKEVAAIVVFAAVISLAVACTLYDVIQLARDRTPNKHLVIFSFYSNGIKLFACSGATPGNAGGKPIVIECLHGIRVLSMVWVVFSHNYMRTVAMPLVNGLALMDWLKSYHSMLVIASTVSVDSFFLMSGILICWAVLNELDKQRTLNVPLMYFHRYLRLTPALAALILFTTTLMPHTGSGPFWDTTMDTTGKACSEYWWSTLLYVQNYVNPDNMCLAHSWYLSVDMQLYLLAPLLLYPLWRWGYRVIIAIVVLILASMACVYALFTVNELRLSFLSLTPERNRQVITYYPTHTRVGAWLVGILYGYLLQRTKRRIVHLPRSVLVAGWTLTISCMLVIIFGYYPLQQLDYDENPLFADALYESTNRVVWAAAVGWIVFVCVNGYGGPVNRFLSLPLWQPLGRLSYSVYLLHLPLQMMMAGATKVSGYFSDILSVHTFWGDIGFTFTLAILWSLLFESPIVGLEKLLFDALRRKPKKMLLETGNGHRIPPPAGDPTPA